MSKPHAMALARAINADPARRYLIRGGTVVTMTEEGVRSGCDLLVDGNRIVAVGPGLAVDPSTPVIDAAGMIVAPGFHDTHRHCWQTAFRRAFAGAAIGRYFEAMHVQVGPACRPEDIYAGTALAAATALDGGITTLNDFAHNCRSAAHADAGLDALAASGIRAVYAYGPPLIGNWADQWPQDLPRVRDAGLRAGPRVEVRMAVLADESLAPREKSLSPDTLRTARDAGMAIIADATIGATATANILTLGQAGLLGPDVTLVHGTSLSDEAWRLIADSGTQVALCPTSDMQVGLGNAIPPVQKVLDFGVVAGIGVDVECCLSSDVFAQMQAAYTIQRVGAFGLSAAGQADAPAPMAPLQVLHLATTGGAAVNGLGELVGAIAPGMLADLVLIRARDLNLAPLNDAVATLVLGAGPQNVDTVIVDGFFRKRGGALLDVDVDRLTRLARQSRDDLLRVSGVAG